MKRSVLRYAIVALAALGLTNCARPPLASVSGSQRAAIEARLLQDITVLASDEFGGRKPGTPGEQLTTEFIIRELQAAGFASGTNDPGSEWRAPVPLIATTPESFSFTFSSERLKPVPEQENASAFAFTTGRRMLLDSTEMVFVGTLADAVSEESVAGKIAVMLSEPGVSPARRETLFAKRPAAIITVVEDEAAILNTREAFRSERFLLASEETQRLSAFVTQNYLASKLGERAWADLKDAASKDDFAPRLLDLKASIETSSTRRELTSANVIGMLPGTKPGAGAVLLLGHWDHLGTCGPEGDDDRICNGAVDNASGIAMMLELARRLAASGPHERDIYVLATSAEESGLLGAKAFLENPPLPLDTIVAAFNFDTVAIAPTGTKVGFVGEGETALDQIVKQVLADTRRELGDREFARSFLQRQDGWALLQKGVPAVMITSAFSSQAALGSFLEREYHRASDDVAGIVLGGAVDDLLLHQELVRRVANTALYPGPAEPEATAGGG
jgi:hypothetical protein